MTDDIGANRMTDDSETIDVRGKPYRVMFYDWYIYDALALAPDDWTHEQVVELRDAIRDNFQHGRDKDHWLRENDARLLTRFVRYILHDELPEPRKGPYKPTRKGGRWGVSIDDD